MKLKSKVRVCIDQGAALMGLLKWSEQRMRNGLTILMYHRVLPDELCRDYPLVSLAMPVSAFAEQMQWLAQHHTVLTMRESLSALAGGRSHSKPMVAVTFDDGYADNYELAAPILDQHGLKGTFFVTSGFVASAEPLWFDLAAHVWMQASVDHRHELLARLPKVDQTQAGIRQWMESLKQTPPEPRAKVLDEALQSTKAPINKDSFAPMTIGQLRALHERGHEIASHTVTHPILPQLDAVAIATEVTRAKTDLESWIDDEVVGFCYPNGDSDERVETALHDAGYEYSCTTQPGLNTSTTDPMRLQRVDITAQRVIKSDGSHDALGFRAEVCQWRQWCRKMTFR